MRCACVVLLLLSACPANAQVTDITLIDGNICRGKSIDLGTLILEHPSSVPYSRWKEGNTYLNTSGFSCMVSPTGNTTYTLEYRLSENGNIQTKDAQVTVWLEPNVTVPADTAVCRGKTIILQADSSYAQEVIWRDGSKTYKNGAEVLIETKMYSFVATARNDYCPTTSSATWVVEGHARIRAAGVGYDDPQSLNLCKGATIDLNSLLRFFVTDDENTSYPATYLEGTATWTSGTQPVADAANYKIPAWEWVAATVTAKVAHTSVCDGMQIYTIPPTVVGFPIAGYPTTASASCNYRDCPGDPVDIRIFLTTYCNDTIKDVNITYAGNSVGAYLSYPPTPHEHTYLCEPIPDGAKYTVYLKTTALDTTMYVSPTPVDPPNVVNWPVDMCKGEESVDFYITTDCDEISTIEWTVIPAAVSKPVLQPNYTSHSWTYWLTATENATYTAKIEYRRKGKTVNSDTTIFITLPLAIRPSMFYLQTSPSEICNGDSAFVVITSDCDSIVAVDGWNIATPAYIGRSKKMMAYETTVSQNMLVQARVTYYDQSTNMNSTTYVAGQLNVRNYPPAVSPASYNLCRGSKDTARIVADDCDSIVKVVWKDKQGGVTISPQPSLNPNYPPTRTEWQYILSPNDSITYIAEIEYMRSSETTTQTVPVEVFVSVRERPHILKRDTVPVCETDAAVYLNKYVDSALVNMNTIDWLGYPNAIASNSQYAPEKTYQVQAEYAYLCSEMTTLAGAPEQLTVLFQTSKKPAFQAPAPNGTYCQNNIPLKAVEQFTAYKWILPGGIEIDKPDTIYSAATAGEFNFTLTAKNECGVNSTDSKVFLSAIPYVTALNPVIEACEGSTVTLALSDYEQTGMISWNEPSFGQAEPVITVTTPATYIVSVTNIPCPTAYDTIVVNVIRLAHVEAMDDIDVCENSELTLSVKSWNGENLGWVKAEGNNIFIPVANTVFPVTAPGTYIAIASNQCNRASDTVLVTMTLLPFVSIRTDTTSCLGDTITLVTESLNGTPAWFTDGRRVEPKITIVATPTVYTVIASNKCGESEPASITVFARPPIAVKPAQMPAFKNNTYYDIRFSAENAMHPVSYSLNGNLPAGLVFKSDGSIVGFPRLSGNNYYDYPLTIMAKDAGNCQAVYDYILSPAWSAPNAFLPGSSGFNSVFLSEYQLEIYDRSGHLVHEGYGWTGIDQNGRRAPAGTYYYKVIIPQNSHNHVTRYFSGYITVLPQ
ncbi:MAG: gliding motility-associated C-terminal domain-containing protein [Prevotellaceae bacterium]|jgi:hypothetical protein|nr:gliding motility-associated C-terminal domain-containing protein [Prevotellaceae bacterium]